jgi:hypothetical protein
VPHYHRFGQHFSFHRNPKFFHTPFTTTSPRAWGSDSGVG